MKEILLHYSYQSYQISDLKLIRKFRCKMFAKITVRVKLNVYTNTIIVYIATPCLMYLNVHLRHFSAYVPYKVSKE